MYKKSLPFTVSYYLKNREFSNDPDIVPSDIGINWIAPFPDIERFLHESIGNIFDSNKIICYTRPGGEKKDRELASELLNMYSGEKMFSADDVIFTNSSSEALEFVFGYLSAYRYDVILPLPCYFKYDLLATRKGISINAYYNNSGKTYINKQKSTETCMVINNPEAISGCYKDILYFDQVEEQLNLKSNIYLFDLCYLMLDNHPQKPSPEIIKDINVHKQLKNCIFTFSPSKDISLSGLRAGLLVSKNGEVIEYAKNKILERYFSLNIISTQVTILYLILLNIYRVDNNLVKSKSDEIKKILKYYDFSYSALSYEFLMSFKKHQEKIIQQIIQNFNELTNRYCDYFDFSEYRVPDSGFSSLWRAKIDLPSIQKITKKSHYLSINKRVNLFPAYFNGGNLKAWNSLYPNEFLIRVNASIPLKISNMQIDEIIAGFDL